jgi:hypothetical protein
LFDESAFVDPFPAGLLQTVDALVWNPVKAEPAVKVPESAVADPTLITGV